MSKYAWIQPGAGVFIGDFNKYFRPRSRLMFSSYDGFVGVVLERRGWYAWLYVPDKLTKCGKAPITKVPLRQCERVISHEVI